MKRTAMRLCDPRVCAPGEIACGYGDGGCWWFPGFEVVVVDGVAYTAYVAGGVRAFAREVRGK